MPRKKWNPMDRCVVHVVLWGPTKTELENEIADMRAYQFDGREVKAVSVYRDALVKVGGISSYVTVVLGWDEVPPGGEQDVDMIRERLERMRKRIRRSRQ